MKYSINKHANDKYLITVTKAGYLRDKQYEPFCELFFHSNFRDVKRFLNMEQEEGVLEVSITMKASLETLEITLAIMEDYKYYDTTGLEDSIKEIKLLNYHNVL